MRQKSQLEILLESKRQKLLHEMREVDNTWSIMHKLGANFECQFLELKRRILGEQRDSIEEIQLLAKPKSRTKKKVLLTETNIKQD